MTDKETSDNSPSRARSARSALDAWLDKSARVLEQQRAHSISPSFVEAVAKDRELRTTLDMRSIETGLMAILSMLSADPGRWILIFEHGSEDSTRYLQYLLCEDGSLVVETVSNYYLEDWATRLLTGDDEALLAEFGWDPPDSDHHNWQYVESTINPDIEAVANLGVQTLRRSFGCSDDDEITVILFSSPNREGTPASSSGDSDDLPGEDVEREEPNEGNDPQEPHWNALRYLSWEELDGLPWLIDVNRWAARAIQAWLVAEGLATEIRRLAESDPSNPTPTPGLDQLLEEARAASIDAHHAADKRLRDDSPDGYDAAVRCAHKTLQAERAARLIAQLAMGVSACHGSGPITERLDRAAVAVITDPLTGERMSTDTVKLASTTAEGLLPEIAGLICRAIIEPGTVIEVGPVEMAADKNGGLTVTLDGQNYRWRWPVRVHQPAQKIAGALPPCHRSARIRVRRAA